MKITISERSLSDKSKVYSVIVRDDNDGVVELECVSQKHARLLQADISKSVAVNTNYVESALA